MNVLDHGFVRLKDHMGSDLSVVQAARVSYDEAWKAGEDTGSDTRLINYLWKNRHTTPFESVVFKFEIKAPIFVFRQWHRHRTWSFNELSGRYRPLPEEFYIPDPLMVGRQSTSNKQGRQLDEVLGRAFQTEKMRLQNEAAFRLYDELLADDWPKELARTVLPVATYSHMEATVDLLNLLKFLTLRADAHAQYEIRVYAEAMLELIRPHVSVTVAAWEANR